MWRSLLNELIISEVLHMNAYPKLLKRKLFSIIHQMAQNSDDFVLNPGKDFTRSRKLDFETMFKVILGMNGNVLRKELYVHFNYDDETATSSAFCQQRAKLKPSGFEHLFNQFTLATTKTRLYNNYRLLAVDGSALNIYHDPNNPDTFVRHTCNNKGYNALHLNALYDLQNRIYTDALVQPEKCMNEYQALCDMVDRSTLTDNVLVIGDRGYESYNVFAHIAEKDWKYLIRIKDLTSNGIARGLDLPDTEEFDTTVTLQLSRSNSKKTKAALPYHKNLPKTTPLDFLKDLHSHYTMTFRMIRFKTFDNSHAMVITNLDSSEFPELKINDLYQMRWGIETSFRELKYSIGLIAFHSKKVELILQEVYACLVLYNFCEMITSEVIINKENTKYDYQVNFTAAIDICKKFFTTKKYKHPPNVEALIQQNTLPIRKDRKFKRCVRRGRTISFTYRVA